MNDTSATVKLRWEETIVRVVEAEVPVDQLPDRLIEYVDDTSWSIVSGDVDSYEVIDFLDALDMAGAAVEVSTGVESRYISDECELVPPVMVAAAPVHAIEARFPDDELPAILPERMAEFAEEVTEVTGITECERLGEHQKSQRHRWQECPAYHGEGTIE